MSYEHKYMSWDATILMSSTSCKFISLLSAAILQLYKGGTPPKLVLRWHIVNLGPFIDNEMEPSSVNVLVGYSMDM